MSPGSRRHVLSRRLNSALSCDHLTVGLLLPEGWPHRGGVQQLIQLCVQGPVIRSEVSNIALEFRFEIFQVFPLPGINRLNLLGQSGFRGHDVSLQAGLRGHGISF